MEVNHRLREYILTHIIAKIFSWIVIVIRIDWKHEVFNSCFNEMPVVIFFAWVYDSKPSNF